MATLPGQPVRNHIFHEVTRSLCPECGRVIDAQVLIRDGGVYLRKRCPTHGWHEALVSSDSDWYINSLKYSKPGAMPHHFATKVSEGCPDDCGICPEHQQHTCVGVIEITDRCNLACPTCFANAGSGSDLSVEQVEFMLDTLVRMEGQPEVVQISGGEPTVHPRIVDILAAASTRGIRCTMLNTNGIRLAQEPDFARRIAQYRPYIYLQFDGLRAETHQALRGQDLRAIKQQALDNIAEAGLYAILVTTVVEGVNGDEIGDILRFGLDSPAVMGICYQPVAYTGRCLNHHDPLHRATVPQVLHALETQTDGLFRVDDFRPVPCPHPTCSACTCAYVGGGTVIPITRLVNVDDYLDFLTNSAGPVISDNLGTALDSLWSMANVAGSEKTTEALNCIACGINIPLSDKPELSAENFFVVNVHGFMDEHTFDLKRLMKCCVHRMLPDGRAVPLCAYNNLGHRESARLRPEASDDR